jgi:nicotinamidase-related amidase
MSKFSVLEADRTALLVIDVQRALFTRPHPVYRDTAMLHTINDLVDRAHLYGAHIVYIQHSNSSFLKENSDGWKLHPALKPGAQDYSVRKSVGNAFQEPSVMSVMEARDIHNVLVTGLVTQGCVRATSLGGIKLGYQMFLVKGAHSNYNQDPEAVIEKNENDLESQGVHVIDPGEVAFK